MTEEELISAAASALADIDRRRLFWVDLGLGRRANGSLDDFGTGDLDWVSIRSHVDQWVDALDPFDTDMTTTWPVTDRVMIFFQARPRSEMARGAPTPSFTHSQIQIPTLHFETGEERALADLSVNEVLALARGHKRLALEIPSHRTTFESIAESMEYHGYSNTSEMHPTELEVFGSMLGLLEAPPGLGDFDVGWRAIYGLPDPPIIDDPRDE